METIQQHRLSRRDFLKVAAAAGVAGLLAACHSTLPAIITSTPPFGSITLTPTSSNEELIRALKSLHFDKYLKASDVRRTHTSESGWDVYHYDPSDCQCILGGEYFIMARKGTEVDKTVLWLEGGGSCWPDQDDCTKKATFYNDVTRQGLASPDSRNPVGAWNFVYVPYCDGSIHLGDNDADYDGDGIVDHWHWGLKTTSAAVRLMKELFPASQRILVAGCSAGGDGSIGVTPVVRLQFPEANLYVLNESGPGLIPPDKKKIFELIKQTWNVEQFIPSDCTSCNDQFVYMYAWLLARDSRLKVGMFASYQDATISSGWGMPPQAFESLLVDTTDSIQKDFPDTFKRYFIKGDSHCVRDYAYQVNDISIWDWVNYLVNDDSRWTDVLEQ